MRTVAGFIGTIALLAGLASCLSFNPASGTIRCSSDPAHLCPDGYVCVEGMCWKNGEQPSGNDDLSTGGSEIDMSIPALKSNGTTCATAGECSSANCVDSVCCDTACIGACSSCNVAGLAGTCSPVSAGAMPAHGTCGAQAPSSCGRDGTCDGNGSCRKWLNVVCRAGSCAAGKQIGDSKCDGSGNCVAPTTMVACDPYVCKPDGTACFTSCTDSTQCLSPNPCNTSVSPGSCGPKNNGLSCSTGADCKSSNCVDTVCCDTALAQCSGCKSCNLSTPGTCASVPMGQDPHGSCTGVTCAAGGCNGGGSCTPSSSSKVCSTSGTCSNMFPGVGQQYQSAGGVTMTFCNGTATGSCSGAMTSNCDPYTCASGTACLTTCSVDSTCTLGNYCSGTNGTCLPKKAKGATCARDEECGDSANRRICLNNVCTDCRTDRDCVGFGGAQICASGTCLNCGSAANCTTAGWGNACSSGICSCTSSSQCTVASAPYCNGGGCMCGDGTSGGSGTSCRPGYVCSNSGATGQCKMAAGGPCVLSSICLSGVCNNGVCS